MQLHGDNKDPKYQARQTKVRRTLLQLNLMRLPITGCGHNFRHMLVGWNLEPECSLTRVVTSVGSLDINHNTSTGAPNSNGGSAIFPFLVSRRNSIVLIQRRRSRSVCIKINIER